MKKIALILMLAGCGSTSFETTGFHREDEDAGPPDVHVVPDVIIEARSDVLPDVPPEASPDVQEEPDAGCSPAKCPAPEHSEPVCVEGACDFKCPAACTRTNDGCDCPGAQCCDDQDCGGVSCNRGQCSGTYSKCDEPRCWAWCVHCLGKAGGTCNPDPPPEGSCQCELS